MPCSLQVQYWIERVALFGDQAAYEKIFDHFYEGMFNLAYTFVKDEHASEDIVSNAFMAIWRQRERLAEIDNLKLYLYVTVKNLSIKHCSKQKMFNDLDWNALHLSNVSDTAANPEDLLISKEALDRLRNAVNDLPPKCKLIFKLVREDGLKYKEIAQLLDISVKTIEAQMTIAGKRITRSLHLSLKKEY